MENWINGDLDPNGPVTWSTFSTIPATTGAETIGAILSEGSEEDDENIEIGDEAEFGETAIKINTPYKSKEIQTMADKDKKKSFKPNWD